jgi:hypothetical protein
MTPLFIVFQVFLSILMVVSAYPQDSENRGSNQDKRERETTTQIPILKYNKEQGQDGSYQTQ